MVGKKVSKSSPLAAGVLRWMLRGLAALPLSVARLVGRALGHLLWLLPNQFRAVSERNVARCLPELDKKAQRRLVRASLISTGLSVGEAGAMFHWDEQRLAALEEGCEGAEIVEAGLARGRGVILLGPHLGNWEYVSHAIGRRWGMIALYRPPRIRELELYIRQARQHLGTCELVPADARGLRRILEGLRSGQVVGILPDQEPLKENGVFAPFFGISALTMTLVGRLVRRFDPQVAYGVAERTAAGRFRIRFFEAPAGIGDADAVRAAAALNRGVEELVRGCPEQYTWSYRRFKTRPPAELAARARGSD